MNGEQKQVKQTTAYQVYGKWSNSSDYWISEFYGPADAAMNRFLDLMVECMLDHEDKTMKISKDKGNINTAISFEIEEDCFYTIGIEEIKVNI